MVEILTSSSFRKKTEKLAYFDQLTNLPNRQKNAFGYFCEFSTACAILILMNLKEINDFLVLKMVIKFYKILQNGF